jgi:hypothetical protein
MCVADAKGSAITVGRFRGFLTLVYCVQLIFEVWTYGQLMTCSQLAT